MTELQVPTVKNRGPKGFKKKKKVTYPSRSKDCTHVHLSLINAKLI